MNFEDKLNKVWNEKRPDIKSGRELERLIGLSNGSISKWRKSNPSQKTIEKIASFFKVTPDYLLGYNDENKTISTTTDLANDQTVLSFDGQPVSDEAREKIMEYVQFVMEQEKGKNGK